MATKTIGITEEVYNRLAAEQREDESFTETVARLLSETSSDWRRGFGRWSEDEAEEVEEIVADAKRSTSVSMSRRTDEVLEAMGYELDADGNIRSHPDDTEHAATSDERETDR